MGPCGQRWVTRSWPWRLPSSSPSLWSLLPDSQGRSSVKPSQGYTVPRPCLPHHDGWGLLATVIQLTPLSRCSVEYFVMAKRRVTNIMRLVLTYFEFKDSQMNMILKYRFYLSKLKKNTIQNNYKTWPRLKYFRLKKTIGFAAGRKFLVNYGKATTASQHRPVLYVVLIDATPYCEEPENQWTGKCYEGQEAILDLSEGLKWCYEVLWDLSLKDTQEEFALTMKRKTFSYPEKL